MISYENYKLKESVSNRKPKKHSVAFYERGSWYHRTKSIDNNGKIKYGKKAVFPHKKKLRKTIGFVWRNLSKAVWQGNLKTLRISRSAII